MDCVDSVSSTLLTMVRIGVLRAILHWVWCLPHGLCGFSVCQTAGVGFATDVGLARVLFQMPSEGKVAQTEFGKRQKVVCKLFPNVMHIWQN